MSVGAGSGVPPTDANGWYKSLCGVLHKTVRVTQRHNETCTTCLSTAVAVERERADAAEAALAVARHAASWANLSDERIADVAACERSGRFEDRWHDERARAAAADATIQRVRDLCEHAETFTGLYVHVDYIRAALDSVTPPTGRTEK